MMIFALLAMLIGVGWSAEPPTCPTDEAWLEPTAYLKAISLDLRGVVPTLEEYETVVEMGAVPEDWIDQWLDSEGFVDRAVRSHRDLFWNNVSDTILLSAAHRFRTTDGIYWRSNTALNYRGAAVFCGNFEATMVDGYPVPVDQGDGTAIEGWVEVEAPYWDPDNPVKVCAFDAQERAVTTKGTACDSGDGRRDSDCGCGPDLRWCAITSVHRVVSRSFSEDVDRRVAENIRDDASYFDLLTGRFGYVNGPIVDYLRHRTGVPANIRFTEWPIDVEGLPDLAFTDVDEWVRIDLGAHHSGVLTSPAFLLRFQTDRARANRFYNTFMCQPFEAPQSGLNQLDDEAPSLDLTARPGCNGCHALLEPAAAYWGRWTPQGGGYLDDETFPAFNSSCERCVSEGYSCSSECKRYYLSDPLSSEQIPYIGWLNAYAFLDPGHEEHISLGPKLLVSRSLADGRLTECVTKTAVQGLLRRDLRSDEADWLDSLHGDFVNSAYRYRSLIKAIVTSENYRRVR
jgi:hypothetical protein